MVASCRLPGELLTSVSTNVPSLHPQTLPQKKPSKSLSPRKKEICAPRAPNRHLLVFRPACVSDTALEFGSRPINPSRASFSLSLRMDLQRPAADKKEQEKGARKVARQTPATRIVSNQSTNQTSPSTQILSPLRSQSKPCALYYRGSGTVAARETGPLRTSHWVCRDRAELLTNPGASGWAASSQVPGWGLGACGETGPSRQPGCDTEPWRKPWHSRRLRLSIWTCSRQKVGSLWQ